MRLTLRVAGNVLIGLCVLGFLGLGALAFLPSSQQPELALTRGPLALSAPVISRLRELTSSGRTQPVSSSLQSTSSAPAANQGRPITRLVVPSIGLDTDVVDATMVAVDGGYTWQVPAFKVGHAESTAGAGEVGNAVLLGHVTSLHSGNVFADLERVRVGDDVQVFSDDRELDYVVVSTRAVPRTDSSVLQPTPTPTVSLITCTGLWLPTIWDYTERLVVQAELAR